MGYDYQPITILLQVVGKYDKEYHVYRKCDYIRKLAEIRLAMIASGDEYYVYLVRKSQPKWNNLAQKFQRKSEKSDF